MPGQGLGSKPPPNGSPSPHGLGGIFICRLSLEPRDEFACSWNMKGEWNSTEMQRKRCGCFRNRSKFPRKLSCICGKVGAIFGKVLAIFRKVAGIFKKETGIFEEVKRIFAKLMPIWLKVMAKMHPSCVRPVFSNGRWILGGSLQLVSLKTAAETTDFHG